MSTTEACSLSTVISFNDLKKFLHPKLTLKKICNEIAADGFTVINGTMNVTVINRSGDLDYKPVANFVFWPVREFQIRGDKEPGFEYEVKGIMLDGSRELPAVRLNLRQLKTADWIRQYWGIDPFVEHGMYPEAMKAFHCLRKNRIHATLIKETGWHQIDSHWHYVHAAGVISNCLGGNEIHGDLAGPKFARYTLPNRCSDPTQATAVMHSVLEIGKPCIAYPLVTMIWMPPLAELFYQQNLPISFIPFLKGLTSCGKSSLAGLALSAFGNMDKHSFPASFRDTVASTEKTFATLKDALCVVDDFHPRSPSEQSAMNSFADSIARMVADGNVRNRYNQDSVRPQAVVLATGETIPSIAASGLSRYLFIDCQAEDLDYVGKFSGVLQKTDLLREAMCGYLLWIAANWDRVHSMIGSAFSKHFGFFSSLGEGRSVSAVAQMACSMEVGLTFLYERGQFDESVMQEHLKQNREVLADILRDNLQVQSAVSPADNFLLGLQTAINCGQAALVPIASKQLSPRAVGCYDDANIYLLPAKTYDLVNRFLSRRRRNSLLPEKEVWLSLAAKNIIHWDPVRNRHTRQKRIPGLHNKNADVLVIDRKFVPELAL